MVEDPDWFADNYEYQVPIFVVTHHILDKHLLEPDKLFFTFVIGGVECATTQAGSAAGEKDFTVNGGACIIRQILKAGIADELHIDIMPILLGTGLRLFEDTGISPGSLERLYLMELPSGRIHLKFRIRKQVSGTIHG